MNQKVQALKSKYVEQHSACRWMDCGELEELLNEFADKMEAEHKSFLCDVKEMRKMQSAYFKERKQHGYTPLASQLLSESRKLEKKVDEQLSEPQLLLF